MDEDLLTIGAFSRATLLSPKALRRYHESGLLVPAVVDARTGYRGYTRVQLGDAGVIRALRELDVPLLQTGGIAFDCADPTKLAGFWAAATEREVDGSSNDEFALVGRPGEAGAVPPMLFVRVPEPKSAKNRPRE